MLLVLNIKRDKYFYIFEQIRGFYDQKTKCFMNTSSFYITDKAFNLTVKISNIAFIDQQLQSSFKLHLKMFLAKYFQ